MAKTNETQKTVTLSLCSLKEEISNGRNQQKTRIAEKTTKWRIQTAAFKKTCNCRVRECFQAAHH